MLKEAQREYSARSSARVSPISSAMMSLSSTCKNTPSTSPKSPPNSPNVELADFKDLKEQLRKQGVFINRSKFSKLVNFRNKHSVMCHIQFRSFLLVSKNRFLPSNQTPTERIETVHIDDAYFRANGYSRFKAFILLMVINDPILMMTHYLSGVRTY